MAPQMDVEDGGILLLQPSKRCIRHVSFLCMRNWPLRFMESNDAWMKVPAPNLLAQIENSQEICDIYRYIDVAHMTYTATDTYSAVISIRLLVII